MVRKRRPTRPRKGALIQLKSTNQRVNKMIATKTGMEKYSTQELINYVERTDKKVKAVPASIRRNSFSRWNSNSAAICAEIQNRQGFAAHKVIEHRAAK